MEKPTAYLTITQGRVMVSYCVYNAAGRLLWATRAYPGPEGVDGARKRVRAWMKRDGYKVVMREEVRHAGAFGCTGIHRMDHGASNFYHGRNVSLK